MYAIAGYRSLRSNSEPETVRFSSIIKDEVRFGDRVSDRHCDLADKRTRRRRGGAGCGSTPVLPVLLGSTADLRRSGDSAERTEVGRRQGPERQLFGGSSAFSGELHQKLDSDGKWSEEDRRFNGFGLRSSGRVTLSLHQQQRRSRLRKNDGPQLKDNARERCGELLYEVKCAE